MYRYLNVLPLLSLLSSLFWFSHASAAACVDGANPLGCTISTTGITYTLTGDIAPALGVDGIKMTAADTTSTTMIGDITTSGAGAYGIYLNSSDYNITTMTGDISTTGDRAYALPLSTNNSITTLTGNISTTGEAAYALYLTYGDSNITSLTGDISTTKTNAFAIIQNNIRDSITTLTGDITTTGDYAYSIYLTNSDTNTTTMTGNMSTAGDYAYGIYLRGSDTNTTTLTGDMSTAGDYAFGIHLDTSIANTTTLIGDMSTTGDYASGIHLDTSVSNTTTLIGDMSTIGYGARGIFLSDSDANITTMTGDISTTGEGARGIYLIGSDANTTTMNGDINTTGSTARGIQLSNSASNTTTMTGNISTTGATADGMLLRDSDANVINFTGAVSATGTGSYAVYANSTSDNNTLTFNQGSTIIGGFYNDGTNNTLNFNLGRAASYNFTTSGTVDWVLSDTSKTVVAGSAKSRGAADMDDAGNRLYQRFNAVYDRLIQEQRQVAQGSVRRDAWLDSYYTDSERNTVGRQLNQETRGITAGFNVSGERDLAMDFIMNVENTDSGYGLSEQTIDSNSLMLGLSFPQLLTANEGTLGVQLLAGVSDNDRALVVLDNTLTTGKTLVTDDYNNVYVSAGAQWLQALQTTQRFQSDLVVGMDVTHAQIEGSAASAYYVLADRDLTQMTTRAQYGITIQGMNKQLNINGSIGLAHASIIDGASQQYTIDGTAVRYQADKSNTYASVSLGASYEFTPQARAYLNVKRFDSNDDIDGITGNAGLTVLF